MTGIVKPLHKQKKHIISEGLRCLLYDVVWRMIGTKYKYTEEECLLTQTKERSITNKLHETPEHSTTDSVDHAKT